MPRRGLQMFCRFFFFNDTATTEIYTLSLHDALPIFAPQQHRLELLLDAPKFGLVLVVAVLLDREHLGIGEVAGVDAHLDRKSTRLNSSHANISYAVFCLKKKNKIQ